MQNLTVTTEKANLPAAKQASLLPPSMRQEIELSSAGEWNLQQAKERLSYPVCQRVMRTELTRLNALLKAAEPREIMACLGKLTLHYPMTNMSESEKTMLLEDYIDDLSHYPAWAIAEVCREYRTDPTNQFFPKAAVLPAMAKKACAYQAKIKQSIERILDSASQNSCSPVRNLAAALTAEPPRVSSNSVAACTSIPLAEKVKRTIAEMRKAGVAEGDIEEFAMPYGGLHALAFA